VGRGVRDTLGRVVDPGSPDRLERFSSEWTRGKGDDAKKGTRAAIPSVPFSSGGGDDGPAILPGKSAESRLIRYVTRLDDDHSMPPEGTGKPLTPICPLIL
jgi:hypothetical protein